LPASAPSAALTEHLDAYLDEFTFRFNRRKSRNRGKLFYRLLEQAVAVEPSPTNLWSNGRRSRPCEDHKMLWVPESDRYPSYGNPTCLHFSPATPSQASSVA
jgi:hypothetical protein